MQELFHPLYAPTKELEPGSEHAQKETNCDCIAPSARVVQNRDHLALGVPRPTALPQDTPAAQALDGGAGEAQLHLRMAAKEHENGLPVPPAAIRVLSQRKHCELSASTRIEHSVVLASLHDLKAKPIFLISRNIS
jgi:hypothetical protein